MHFDYCTTACTGFVLLDEATLKDILQASYDITVFGTSAYCSH
jgi:hypothetical protein